MSIQGQCLDQRKGSTEITGLMERLNNARIAVGRRGKRAQAVIAGTSVIGIGWLKEFRRRLRLLVSEGGSTLLIP